MKTKYPILLVHGIILKDTFFFKAFGKIPNELRKEGFLVYCSTNDGVGTIENNAKQIKKQILNILEKENAEKINLIAHSKGGLDSKYMIMNLDMEDKVASLTTLCTPHKGSQLATKILELPKRTLKFLSCCLNFSYKIFGDKKPNALKACKQLKADTNIETSIINFSNKVYCQSYSSILKDSSDDILMAIPHILLKKYDKDESDGMVSNVSAQFGKYKGTCVDDSISHTEIVDLMTNKSEKEKIYNFYKKICKDLIKKGF